LHGATEPERRAVALELGRTLLCAAPAEQRPCGACQHCRRIAIADPALFHPDFLVLERDLKTSTSVDAVKAMLRGAQQSPFEARGQVFVLTSAESLGGGGANALLKTLEEPPLSAPRHFLLLAPAAADLLATIRSRCLEVYLGVAGGIDRHDPAFEAQIGEVADSLDRYLAGGGAIYLQVLTRQLQALGGRFDDVRDATPWQRMASALVALSARHPRQLRMPILGLAEALLGSVELRLRNVPAPRIVDGLVSRWLAQVPEAGRKGATPA
jgi:hypothetical protein